MSLKFNNSYILILIALTIIISSGCKSTNTDLDNFYSQIDNALSSKERTELIECADVDCIMKFMFPYSNPEIKRSNPEIIQLFSKIPSKINDSLDSAGVEQHRTLVLLMCYNKHKNGKTCSFKDVELEINKYFDNQEQILDQQALENIKQLTEIAEINYNKINIGDTICLKFPLEYSKGVYEALYRKPQEKEKLIYLSCRVLKKKFIPKNNEYKFAQDEFDLTMEIIKLSHTSLKFLGVSNNLNQGDKITLDIFHYGREITRDCADN